MASMMIGAVTQQAGTSKAGNKYSMHRARALMPFSPRHTPSFDITGRGVVEVELAIDDSCAGQLNALFNANFKGLPVLVDVETTIGEGGVVRIVSVKDKPTA